MFPFSIFLIQTYPIPYSFRSHSNDIQQHSTTFNNIQILKIFLGYITVFSLIIGIFLLLIAPNIIETIINTVEGIEDVPLDILYIGMFYLVTATALMFGMFGHLWEDSTTVSGIKWFPNKKYSSSGNLKVGGNNENVAFGVYSGIGLIIVLFELGNAADNQILQIIFPIIAFLTFLGLGAIFRQPVFGRIFGVDILLKDIKTREKAKRNSIEITIRGFSYQMERDRIKRGQKIAKEFKTLGRLKKRVNQTIIDQGGGSLACSCKDFKVVHDLTLCKHLIAYMYLKYPDDQKKIEKQS